MFDYLIEVDDYNIHLEWPRIFRGLGDSQGHSHGYATAHKRRNSECYVKKTIDVLIIHNLINKSFK